MRMTHEPNPSNTVNCLCIGSECCRPPPSPPACPPHRPLNARAHPHFHRDKLRQRNRYPLEDRVHEMFHAGRSHGLKDYMHIPQHLLFFEFYANANVDGLIRRTEIMNPLGTRIVEEFEHSDDFLVYRSITTCPADFATVRCS